MSRVILIPLCGTIILSYLPCAFGQQARSNVPEWTLSPVVVKGSPVDALLEDPIVPVMSGGVQTSKAEGSVAGTLRNQIALPTTESGRPGELTQFRGLGIQVDDTAVQALGVPLNPPQGLGLDYSVFPDFLWATYRYQLGPSPLTLDPRGVSGSLTLVPWSQAALSQEGRVPFRVTQYYTSRGLLQMSVATKQAESFAMVLGYTGGNADGPSGVMSVQKKHSSRWTSRFHLLGTQYDAQTLGTLSQPTPNARQLTARLIPILQSDYQMSQSAIWKNSVYLDVGYIRYDSPDGPFPFFDRTHTRQLGIESALVVDLWRFGLTGRHTTYQSQGVQRPAENQLSLYTARVIPIGDWIFEPQIQAIQFTEQDPFVAGSLGARHELNSIIGVFSRLSYSRRFPSLEARFGNGPFAVGNPELAPETDVTLLAGLEAQSGNFKNTFQGVLQWREDLHASITQPKYQIINRGSGRLYALVNAIDWRLAPWVRLNHSMTYSFSRMDETDQSFPFLPSLTSVLRATIEPTGAQGIWAQDLSIRGATRAYVSDFLGSLPGYAYVDLGLRARLGSIRPAENLELRASLENVLNQSVVLNPDFPSLGRAVNLSLLGQF